MKLNERSESDDFLGLFWSIFGFPIAYYKKKTKKVQDQTKMSTINLQNLNIYRLFLNGNSASVDSFKTSHDISSDK